MNRIANVKAELPMVKVTWRGKLWWAKVTGRLNRFASVSPYLAVDDRNKYPTPIMGPIEHFSWDAVARAHFDGAILRVETA